jgi:transcriptional regulator with XRE-family HTH domain
MARSKARQQRSVPETLGLQVRELRRRKGWNQQRLVERLGDIGVQMDRPALSRIEHGERKVTAEEALQLAYVLDVAPVHLLGASFLPESTMIEIAPKVVEDPSYVRSWIRGTGPLQGNDEHFYIENTSLDEVRAMERVGMAVVLTHVRALMTAAAQADNEAFRAVLPKLAESLDLMAKFDELVEGR